jgi:hypothetical protein
MLKGTLTVFVFFIGIAFISVGFVTKTDVWREADISLGVCLIFGSAILGIIKIVKSLRS